MKSHKLDLLAYVFAVLLGCIPIASRAQPASGGQPPPLSKVSGLLSAVSNDNITVRTPGGERRFSLDPKTMIYRSTPASVSDITSGSYVGVEAREGSGPVLDAQEIHIFAEDMRGMGEGHRPAAGSSTSSMTNAVVSGVRKTRPSSMTNATVAKVDKGSTMTLELNYQGGHQTVRVLPSTPIRHLEKTDRLALVAGSEVTVFASGDTTRLIRIISKR